MGGRFTFSKCELAEHCVFAFTKAAPAWPVVGKHIDVRINNAFHWVCAEVLRNPTVVTGPAQVLEQACKKFDLDTDEERIKLANTKPILHAQSFLDRYPITVKAELALAYDRETGEVRILGEDIGRDYILGPTEVAGTLDAAGACEEPDLGYVIEVNDWKLGARARELITPAKGNRQVGCLSMCMTRVMSADVVRQVISFVSEDGYLYRDEYLADPIEDMNETESWLHMVLDRIDKNEDPAPGSHCTDLHCPLLGVCPETQDALVKVEANESSVIPLNANMVLSDDHCVWAMHRLKAVMGLCEQGIDACKKYVNEKPEKCLTLSNGKVFGPGHVITPRIEARGPEQFAILLDALTEEIGEQNAKKMILGTVKAESLKDMLGSQKDYKTIVGALRKRGLVRDDVKTEYRVRKPRG